MTRQTLAVLKTGVVSPVGLDAPTACAAIRAKISNPITTRFVDRSGEWITGHVVPLEKPLRGRAKLAEMAAMAAYQCAVGIPRTEIARIPILLCVAEQNRPGRIHGIDQELFQEFLACLGDVPFSRDSLVIPRGRVGAAVAFVQAQKLIYEGGAPAALVVGVDSLINWLTLKAFLDADRLLTPRNSNGFIPGEAASAVLLGRPTRVASLRIIGMGFAVESAAIDTANPLRADGLTMAIKGALASADLRMHQIDLRITDISGEQYYFKEAALGISRTLRERVAEFDIWHPAECVGEVGSAVTPMMIAVADAACRKGYAPGRSILIHASNDGGERAAIVVRYGLN